MLHFGYGSNLQMSFLKELLPSAEFRMKAYIPNYEIQFNFWSKIQKAGISNIMPAAGQMVHGALFEVPEAEMKALDVQEGIYIGDYERHTFLAMGEDGEWHEADLYQVIEPKGPFKPAQNYVKGMLLGARELDFAPSYLEKIEAMYAEASQES